MFCAFEYDAHFFERFEGERSIPSRLADFIRAARADARNAQKKFEGGAVDLHGKILHIPERPGALRVVFEGEVFSLGGDFLRVESVKALQPVRLIKPVFAQFAARLFGQEGIVHHGHVGGIIHSF